MLLPPPPSTTPPCALPCASAMPEGISSNKLWNLQHWQNIAMIFYTWPGSNWRPSACEADVIATRPQVLLIGIQWSRSMMIEGVAYCVAFRNRAMCILYDDDHEYTQPPTSLAQCADFTPGQDRTGDLQRVRLTS